MQHIDKKKIDSYRVKTIHEGYGPTYLRMYTVKIPVPIETAQAVFAELKANAQDFLPNAIATVEKKRTKISKIQNGHRYIIKMLGPWDAAVEAHRVDEKFFEFLTLQTAPEAGHLQFSVKGLTDTQSEFTIQSIAKSGVLLFHIMYHYLGMAKYFQKKMWEQLCITFHDRCLEVAELPKTRAAPIYSQSISTQGDRKTKTTRRVVRI